ncbi:unnamed protein product, partial [Ascophyllum nodosum]
MQGAQPKLYLRGQTIRPGRFPYRAPKAWKWSVRTMGNCRSSIGIAKDKGKENEDKLEPPSEKTLMKKQELKDVAESDGIKWEEGDAWYVVEAAWVRKWLAYIEGEDSATKPDPINNKLLL